MVKNSEQEKDKKPHKKHLARFFVIGAVFVAYAVVFSIFFDSACIFKRITGIPCPSCGITRAHLAFFRLDFAGAVEMHPLFFYSFIAAGLGVLVHFKPAAAKTKAFNITVAVLILVFIAVYVARMILFFPDTAPMDKEEDSLFGIIASLFEN